MKKNRGEALFWGGVIMLIGLVFLLRNMGYHIDIWHIFTKYWPVILILIGLKNIVYYFLQEK